LASTDVTDSLQQSQNHSHAKRMALLMTLQPDMTWLETIIGLVLRKTGSLFSVIANANLISLWQSSLLPAAFTILHRLDRTKSELRVTSLPLIPSLRLSFIGVIGEPCVARPSA
jgi:hypothetical protein